MIAAGAMHAEPAPRKTPERQLDSFTAGPASSQLTVQEELAEPARQLGHEHQRFAHQPPVHPSRTSPRYGMTDQQTGSGDGQLPVMV
jgi:hypothetical protein